MRKLITLAALAAIISTPGYANPTLNPYSTACLTEDLVSQFTVALYKHDMDAMSYLLENGCSISDKPLKVTVIGLSSWGAMAHVRAYRGKYAAEVWTPRDNLSGYDPLKP